MQPFDSATQQVSGAPRELADDVDSFASTGEASFSFSGNGTLAYAPMEQPAALEWLDRGGRVLGPADEPRPYQDFRLDRTGRWLVASVITPKDGFRDLWLVDLERRTPQRFTRAPGWESSPAWSPDGKRIAFAADWTGPPCIYVQDVGGGEATEVVPFDNAVHRAGSWTPDGRQLLYEKNDPRTLSDLWIVDVDTKERRPLLQSPHWEASPQVSPDGRWIAFTSNESGKLEAYVATFPDLAATRRVSADGGAQPRWRSDSKELYYRTGARAIAAVTIEELDGRPDPGSESIVIQASEDLSEFDVTPDGERFLVVRRTEAEMRPMSRLIVNWEALMQGAVR